jgi:hypothetical protein
MYPTIANNIKVPDLYNSSSSQKKRRNDVVLPKFDFVLLTSELHLKRIKIFRNILCYTNHDFILRLLLNSNQLHHRSIVDAID